MEQAQAALFDFQSAQREARAFMDVLVVVDDQQGPCPERPRRRSATILLVDEGEQVIVLWAHRRSRRVSGGCGVHNPASRP